MTNDDELKRMFGELREADRRAAGVPPMDAIIARGPQAVRRRGELTLMGRAVLLVAASAVLFGSVEVTRLLTRRAPASDVMAVASWTSPTASLLAVPGVQLSVTSLTGSAINLETTVSGGKAHSKGDSL